MGQCSRYFIIFFILLFNIACFAEDNSPSAIQEKVHQEQRIINNPLGIIFYKPTYLLPYYYTGSPYQSIYRGVTPDNQSLDHSEFKAQLSLQLPLVQNILNKPISLFVAYTQVSYWQFYAKSQYFRETNYEPEIFIRTHFKNNWLSSIGAVHVSNGRGGQLERSWNRLYININYSGNNWLISFKPWVLIFKSQSSNLHNPDIAKFLGHERFLFVYKLPYDIETSLIVRNVERLKHITFIGSLSFPLIRHIRGYAQLFSGYGQSLIEYDHHTNSVGVGISLNDWI